MQRVNQNIVRLELLCFAMFWYFVRDWERVRLVTDTRTEKCTERLERMYGKRTDLISSPLCDAVAKKMKK